MKLSQLTKPNLIELHCDLTSKLDIIQLLTRKLYDEHKISDSQAFYQSVMDREKISPTGIDCGIAIPHGKSSTVKEDCFAVAILKSPISSWESVVENNHVKYIFLLAIPMQDDTYQQINLLSTLMTRLSYQQYLDFLVSSQTPEEFIHRLDVSQPDFQQVDSKKSIVAVTACTYGVAHTYLAAEALNKAAQDLGVSIHIEKQGAGGIVDALVFHDIEKAEGVIIAADVPIQGMERFQNKNVIKVNVDEPLKNASKLIQEVLDHQSKQKTTISSFFEILSSTIQSFLPFLIIYGILYAFLPYVSFIPTSLHHHLEILLSLYTFLLYPLFAYSLSISITPQNAIIAALLSTIMTYLGGTMISALSAGFITGILTKYLSKRTIHLQLASGFINSLLKPIIIFIMSLIILGCLWFPIVAIENLIQTICQYPWIYFINIFIAYMVVYDLGGSMNKKAYLLCILLMMNQIYEPYFIFCCVKLLCGYIMLLQSALKRQSYLKAFQHLIFGITENALELTHHTYTHHLLIICSIITALMLSTLSCGLTVPGCGIFAIFFFTDYRAIPLWLCIPMILSFIYIIIYSLWRKRT